MESALAAHGWALVSVDHGADEYPLTIVPFEQVAELRSLVKTMSIAGTTLVKLLAEQEAREASAAREGQAAARARRVDDPRRLRLRRQHHRPARRSHRRSRGPAVPLHPPFDLAPFGRDPHGQPCLPRRVGERRGRRTRALARGRLAAVRPGRATLLRRGRHARRPPRRSIACRRPPPCARSPAAPAAASSRASLDRSRRSPASSPGTRRQQPTPSCPRRCSVCDTTTTRRTCAGRRTRSVSACAPRTRCEACRGSSSPRCQGSRKRPVGAPGSGRGRKARSLRAAGSERAAIPRQGGIDSC